MTNEDIFATFETFIDDTLDRTLEVSLAEQARLELETELKLQCSKKLDTSQIANPGDTYLTAKNLPTDILIPCGNRLFVGTQPNPYKGIPIEQREAYKNLAYYWYFDLLNKKFYLCGSVNTPQAITFPYITIGTSIVDDNNPAPMQWPSGFHILVPMKMAQLYYPIDAGDKSRSWAPEWIQFYNTTKQRLIDWDHAWKLAALGNETPYGDNDEPNPYAINYVS